MIFIYGLKTKHNMLEILKFKINLYTVLKKMPYKLFFNNEEVKNLFQKPDLVQEIMRRRLMMTGHHMEETGFIYQVIKEDPTRKKTRLLLEDRVKY